MTIYFINNKPHMAVDNDFLEVSPLDYFMMLEQNLVSRIEEVESYD